MRNRGIARGRLFMGSLLLFAAAIAWFTGIMLSPHGDLTPQGTEHVRGTIVTFIRNSAIGTLLLTGVAAWLLFPARRPRWPARDYALLAIIGLLVLTSLYNLAWLRFGLD